MPIGSDFTIINKSRKSIFWLQFNSFCMSNLFISSKWLIRQFTTTIKLHLCHFVSLRFIARRKEKAIIFYSLFLIHHYIIMRGNYSNSHVACVIFQVFFQLTREFCPTLLSWSPRRTLSSRELKCAHGFWGLDNCQRFTFVSLDSNSCSNIIPGPRAIRGGGGIQNNYSATFVEGNVFNRGMIGMAKSFNEYKLLKIPVRGRRAMERCAEKAAKTSIINKLCAAQARKSYLKVGDFFLRSRNNRHISLGLQLSISLKPKKEERLEQTLHTELLASSYFSLAHIHGR